MIDTPHVGLSPFPSTMHVATLVHMDQEASKTQLSRERVINLLPANRFRMQEQPHDMVGVVAAMDVQS